MTTLGSRILEQSISVCNFLRFGRVTSSGKRLAADRAYEQNRNRNVSSRMDIRYGPRDVFSHCALICMSLLLFVRRMVYFRIHFIALNPNYG